MKYRCAVIGNPIAHSKSPQIHAGFAQAYGLDLQYDRMLAMPDNFAEVVEQFFAGGGRGLNVTVPFKEMAFQLAEELTPYAQTAGAVNTLWQQNDKLYGDNTDGRGLCSALIDIQHIDLTDKNILILGAGGASRGVLLPLLESSVAHIDILNRTHHKAEVLAGQYDERICAIKIPVQAYDLIINATSAGLSDAEFRLNPLVLTGDSVCYDMVYGKITPFMHWAKKHDCQQVFDGYSMLIAQARLSFHIWFNEENNGFNHTH